MVTSRPLVWRPPGQFALNSMERRSGRSIRPFSTSFFMHSPSTPCATSRSFLPGGGAGSTRTEYETAPTLAEYGFSPEASVVSTPGGIGTETTLRFAVKRCQPLGRSSDISLVPIRLPAAQASICLNFLVQLPGMMLTHCRSSPLRAQTRAERTSASHSDGFESHSRQLFRQASVASAEQRSFTRSHIFWHSSAALSCGSLWGGGLVSAASGAGLSETG